jgi:hypothetical protein
VPLFTLLLLPLRCLLPLLLPLLPLPLPPPLSSSLLLLSSSLFLFLLSALRIDLPCWLSVSTLPPSPPIPVQMVTHLSLIPTFGNANFIPVDYTIQRVDRRGSRERPDGPMGLSNSGGVTGGRESVTHQSRLMPIQFYVQVGWCETPRLSLRPGVRWTGGGRRGAEDRERASEREGERGRGGERERERARDR